MVGTSDPLIYPDPPLKVGDRVRLTSNRYGEKLTVGGEYIVALIDKHPFPPRDHKTGKNTRELDATRDYGTMLHKHGTVVRGRKLIPWFPVSCFHLEHAVPVQKPSVRLIDDVVIDAATWEAQEEKAFARQCERSKNRLPEFWLEPVLPRPYPRPEYFLPLREVEAIGSNGNAAALCDGVAKEAKLPSGDTTRKAGLKNGVFEFRGSLHVAIGGLYSPKYIAVSAWRLIPLDHPLASRVRRPRLTGHQISYHGVMIDWKLKTYIIVGPEIDVRTEDFPHPVKEGDIIMQGRAGKPDGIPLRVTTVCPCHDYNLKANRNQIRTDEEGRVLSDIRCININGEALIGRKVDESMIGLYRKIGDRILGCQHKPGCTGYSMNGGGLNGDGYDEIFIVGSMDDQEAINGK